MVHPQLNLLTITVKSSHNLRNSFQISLFAKDLKTGKILANRTIDFCEVETFANQNVFFHSFLHHLLDNLKFSLKCPFKKVGEGDIHGLIVIISINKNFQGTYIINEHHMPNYVVPGLMKVRDKFMNVQKVRSRLDTHIKTVFESSYITEVCEFK